MYLYLGEESNVHNSCSYLKLAIEARLEVCFFMTFFSKTCFTLAVLLVYETNSVDQIFQAKEKLFAVKIFE